MPPAMAEQDGNAATPSALALFASRLSYRRFEDEDLRVLEAALSAGADVPALLATRSAARSLLQASAAEAFAFTATGSVLDGGTSLAVADFFARAFALVADVEEWLTFAKDSLDNGFYTIASKAFANALAHIHPSHPGHLDSANSIEEKDKINDITGLQNLAKSLSAQHSVQTQSAEYMKRRGSGVHEKYNLQSGKPKLTGSSMFRIGIKTRNKKKLLRSQERNLGDLKQS
ncbi:unnamed protein product [Miscanthus lutarioriparius]|uniref:Uncharacterized protein n=1 Tax=Miscanthus lutarioriparius TaxID=422564 RepID=A0A811QGK4_9POAL|nr:unnamed protein product [Miscanthus lutarioriparius]